MNEIFFRVDERLVHGQILFKWLEHASCSKFISLMIRWQRILFYKVY